jgi:hypothetical protein
VIDVLVFSRDRAAQLDLLLRSIEKHGPWLYKTVTVLHTFSSPEFGLGYRDVIAEHPWVRFVPEVNFESDVRNWLERHTGETVSFLVDDCVFYRDAYQPEMLPWSFRGGDYDYPFSLDGNVYAKSDVIALLEGVPFTGPTELESQGHLHRGRLPFTHMNHDVPCLVGVPANKVSTASQMPDMGLDPRWLNERYLAGDRLQLPSETTYEYPTNDLGAHAELPLVFA